MLSENRKIIVWFLVALAVTLYAKWANLLPGSPNSGQVLAKTTVSSPGFGHLLNQK